MRIWDTLLSSFDEERLRKDILDKIIGQQSSTENELTEEEISKLYRSMLETQTDKKCSLIVEEIENNLPSLLKPYIKKRSKFNSNLHKMWDRPFSLLELFIWLCYELGDSLNKELRPIAMEQNDIVFDVLTRLHARACLTSQEVLALMRNGFASGALSRWRTLHEIAIVAAFICEKGNEVAKQYLEHEIVESYKAALLYKKHSSKLGYEPISEEEIEELKQKRDELKRKYGENFLTQYGWASKALNKKKPSLEDLENATGLSHYRPFYKLSSHAIHANPKGITFNIGLLNNDILLAGPTDTGMTDPGHCTAISLSQVTTLLITYKPTEKRIVQIKVLLSLVNKIGNYFFEIQKSIEDNYKR